MDMSNEVWIYTPAIHKTVHRWRIKEIPVGPKAQTLLIDYLVDDPDQYLFRPINMRKSGGRIRGIMYGKDALRRAIERVCKRTGIELFSPNQIRHAFATDIRQQFGLDACRSMLGHTNTRTTEIYAERDRAMSCDIAL